MPAAGRPDCDANAVGDRRHRGVRFLPVKRDTRVETGCSADDQHEVGIGHRGLHALRGRTPAGPGDSAGAVRTYPQHGRPSVTQAIDPPPAPIVLDGRGSELPNPHGVAADL